MQSLFVASSFQPTQSTQPKLAGQTDYSISFIVGFFLTFVFIGFVSGCFLQHRRYKKLPAERQVEIFQEVETSEKMTPEIDQTVSSQREQQIETLEKIWKMKP